MVYIPPLPTAKTPRQGPSSKGPSRPRSRIRVSETQKDGPSKPLTKNPESEPQTDIKEDLNGNSDAAVPDKTPSKMELFEFIESDACTKHYRGKDLEDRLNNILSLIPEDLAQHYSTARDHHAKIWMLIEFESFEAKLWRLRKVSDAVVTEDMIEKLCNEAREKFDELIVWSVHNEVTF